MPVQNWPLRIFVRSIGLRRIGEAAITCKDTKGARYVASSSTGKEISAHAGKGH